VLKKEANYLLDELMLIIKKLGQLIDQKEERIKELEINAKKRS
tara:strand:- start:312 stop:440 length:129 start_codon:yes stop_codon:yes gene_type:complete